MSKTRKGPKRETCADLVEANARKTMDDLKYLFAAATMSSQDFEHIGKVNAMITTFYERWPRRPRKGTIARRERDAAEATIVSLREEMSSDDKLVLKHYEDIEGRGDPHEAFLNYGLCFDYVEYNETAKYGDFFRWQLSWGGPSDELQFYVSSDLRCVSKTMYRYMDWWDGAGIKLVGDDHALAKKIWFWFCDRGDVVKDAIEKYNRNNDKPAPYAAR